MSMLLQCNPKRVAHRSARYGLSLGLLMLLLVLAGLAPVWSTRPVAAAGGVPAGLPGYFALGLANQPGNVNWMKSSGVPWNYRYQYLAGGVNTGGGWATWNPNGDFAAYYMQDSAANGYIPVFTYYQLLQSAPANGSNEAEKDYNNLNNPATMQAYYADFKLLLDKVRAFGKPVIIHVEPDLTGYMQQRVMNSGNSATSIPAAVASAGTPDLAGLPNTFQGFNWALLRLRDRYAANALLATHVSSWSTGVNVMLETSATLDVAGIAQKTAAFLNTAGIAGNPSGISSYDLLFVDPSDRDAGYTQIVYGDGGARWWDTTNQRFPNFARYDQYLKGVTDGTNRRALLWQVPMGNTIMRTENNTDGHYQDNRVQYWLGGYPQDGHIASLANAGVIGILFGAGAGGQSTYNDAKGDGVTNPAPINGNTQTATVPDDDGGYLRMAAGQYYQRGPLPLTDVGAPPPSPTTTATTTPPPGPTATATTTPIPFVVKARAFLPRVSR